MSAILRWRLAQNRGVALFILLALALVAYRSYGLDRITVLLYLIGLAQGALWGTLGLFFALYRRDVRRARRGELGMLFLLPAGPTRFALAQAAEYLLWAVYLGGGLLLIGAAAAGRFYPEAFGELTRLGLYLGLALVLPFLGLVQLAAATDVAYQLGRVGGVFATVVFLGVPSGIGKILEAMNGNVLWNLGPRVHVGDFGWLLGQVPGLSLAAPPAEWPAWPLLFGALFFLASVLLALRVYHEAEL